MGVYFTFVTLYYEYWYCWIFILDYKLFQWSHLMFYFWSHLLTISKFTIFFFESSSYIFAYIYIFYCELSESLCVLMYSSTQIWLNCTLWSNLGVFSFNWWDEPIYIYWCNSYGLSYLILIFVLLYVKIHINILSTFPLLSIECVCMCVYIYII